MSCFFDSSSSDQQQQPTATPAGGTSTSLTIFPMEHIRVALDDKTQQVALILERDDMPEMPPTLLLSSSGVIWLIQALRIMLQEIEMLPPLSQKPR